jgi:hypothetical protein
MRPHDHTAIPLCAHHHRPEWHGHAGAFRGWDEARRRAWSDDQIARVQQMLFALFNVGPGRGEAADAADAVWMVPL